MRTLFLSQNKEIANESIKDLKNTFENYNLKITSSIMFTDNIIVPFLDIDYVLNTDSEIKSFKTKKNYQENCKKCNFFFNSSYHPQNVFKGIITGEIKRLKRF